MSLKASSIPSSASFLYHLKLGQMSYTRVRRRTNCHVSNIRGGFRINSNKRFSVHRLRSRFVFFLKIFNKLRSSYAHALRSIKKGLVGSCRNGGAAHVGLKRDSSRNGLVGPDREKQRGYINAELGQYESNRLRSFGRSNSFYAEAIADCLEFIKRSSVSGVRQDMLVSSFPSSKLVL